MDVDTGTCVILERSLTAEAGVRAVLVRLAEQMRSNEPGVREDRDPESLHDFRVAVRRTRSLLGQIRRVLPSAARRRFRDELEWVGSLTGPTRDLDVHLAKLPAYRSALPPDMRDELDAIARLLERQRRVQHALLVQGLQSERYARLGEEWARLLGRPWHDGGRNAARPIAEIVSARIRRAFERVAAHRDDLGEDAPAERLHRTRIDCKKLRYLLEGFASLYPRRELRELVRRLKRIQDSLGEIQDCTIQQRALVDLARELAREHVGSGPALDRLGALLEDCQLAERKCFSRTFVRFASPATRRRVSALFGE